jgi:phospholipase/carboxylesterase
MTPAARRKPLSLEHRLRHPDDPSAGAPPPLLVLLHGIGSNELAMASLAGSFDGRFIVVSPRAPITLEPFAFAWFHMTFTDERPIVDLEEVEASRVRLVRFLDEAVAAYGADRDRVFLVGFSQGCVPALATLLEDPELVAGVVCMSGFLPPDLLGRRVPAARLRDKPALVIHGRSDATLVPKLGRETYEALRSCSVAAEFMAVDMGHTTTPESLAAVSEWLSRRIDH